MSEKLLYQFQQSIKQFQPFEDNAEVAVALSGGSDSMALLDMLNNWGKTNSITIVALTVDHKLRNDSSEEAKKLNKLMYKYQIKHHILSWDHDIIKSNIQKQARLARYDILSNWCKEHKILHMFFAHNRDDQAETIMMRKERGSHGPGLAGISSISYFNNIRILRPLLSIDKIDLENYCKLRNLVWFEDPSNQNEKFTRVKIRNLLAKNPELKYSMLKLGEETRLENQRRNNLGNKFLLKYVQIYHFGSALFNITKYSSEDFDIRTNTIMRLITMLSGAFEAPKFSKIKELDNWLLGLDKTKIKKTLHGLVFQYLDNNQILIMREQYKLPGPVKVNSDKVRWDRFMWYFSEDFNGYLIAKWQTKEKLCGSKHIFPALYNKDEQVVAVPLLNLFFDKSLINKVKCNFLPYRSLGEFVI